MARERRSRMARDFLPPGDILSSRLADDQIIERRICSACGERSFRLHTETRRGFCTTAGCIAFFETIGELELVAIGELVAEVKRRTAYAPDIGLSDQLCPRCSTASADVLGQWSRKERRFDCAKCGVSLYGDGYEAALFHFYMLKFRARQAGMELAELARAVR